MRRNVDASPANDGDPPDEAVPVTAEPTPVAAKARSVPTEASTVAEPAERRSSDPTRLQAPTRQDGWLVKPGRDERPRPVTPDSANRTPTDPKDLGERLANLPDGHPSSPRDSDGKPRPPVPDLATKELPYGPWTDADWADHVPNAIDAISDAENAGLSTSKQFGDKVREGYWTPERAAQHASILAEAMTIHADVPAERRAIIAGGLPGAGKTTVLHDQAGIDLSQYVMINPDEFKESLAKRGLVPEIKGLSPMEASALVHEESSYLAWKLADLVAGQGKNVIWDITMSSRDSVQQRLSHLHHAGYVETTGIFVDIPVDVSVRRADQRHRHGEDKYRAGMGSGGRCIPSQAILARYDSEFGSTNRATFEAVKSQFTNWVVFDNSVENRPAVVVAESDPLKSASAPETKDNPRKDDA